MSQQQVTRDPRLFRDVMGRFATGVTVLTLSVDGQLRGVTANAVTSLSLDPMLLLACIDRKSSSHALFERAEAFAVNILEAGQRPLSDMFSRHGAPEQAMSGAPYRLGALGSPLLEGTLAYAECRIAERFQGGDHTIVIGKVEDMAIERPEGEPLVFFSAAYRRLNGNH